MRTLSKKENYIEQIFISKFLPTQKNVAGPPQTIPEDSKTVAY